MSEKPDHIFSCFLSRSYGHRVLDWAQREIEEIASRKGLGIVTGVNSNALTIKLRDDIRERIDKSIMVLFEASGFSWWVAYELAHAIDRKLCSILVLEESLPGYQLDRGSMNVFSELFHRPYKIQLPGDSRELQGEVGLVINKGLTVASRWSRHVTRGSLAERTFIRPVTTVDPILSINGDKRDDLGKVLASWMVPNKRSAGIAITAPPGAGKTHLLKRFASRLADGGEEETTHARDIPPVAVILTTADIPAPFDADHLWGICRDRVVRLQAGCCDCRDPGLLEPFRSAGMFFLLFDGLDEFGSRRPKDLETLIEAFRQLQRERVRVLLTCRQVFWKQKIGDKLDFTEMEILPYTQDQAKKLLAGIRLPGSIRASDGLFKRWILNPLMIGFILAEREEAIGEEVFNNRTTLYKHWAKKKCAQLARDCDLPPEAAFDFFCDLALKLLRNRTFDTALPPGDKLLPRRRDGRAVDLDHLLSSGVLEPSKEGHRLKFFHESVYEFFATWALKDDLRRIADQPPRDGLGTLALANVELDFLQSSAYGFLSQHTGAGFEDELISFLSDDHERLNRVPGGLLRNLVEYLGLTYAGGQNEESIARMVTALLRNENLDVKVRFNAARALERVHPQAPRPYFDFVSDWGDHDWSEYREAVKRMPSYPYVMRGHGEDKPVARRHGAFGPNLERPLKEKLQRTTSEILADVLSENVGCDPDRFPLRLNCSWAWIRWFHADHETLRQEILAKLEDAMARTGIEPGQLEDRKTLVNLKEFVNHPAYRARYL